MSSSHPDGWSPSIVDLARTAVRALSSDVLSLTRTDAAGGTSVLVADGQGDVDTDSLALWGAQWCADFQRSRATTARQVVPGDGLPDTVLPEAPVGVGLVAPLYQDDKLIGVVAALRGSGDFSADERSLAVAFARHFGVALAPRAPAAARYLDGLLEALEEVNRRAASVTRIDELSAMLDPVLASVFGNVRSGLALWDERQDVLRMVSSTFPVDMWQTSLTDFRSSTVRVFLTGTSWVTDRALTDPGVLADQPVRFEIERLVQIQLNAAGHRIGVLSIAMEDHPSPELLETIERLAPHLATVVEFARTAARLRQRGDLTAAVSSIAVAIADTSQESGDRDLASAVDRLKGTVGANALIVERDGTQDIVAADPDVADYAARLLVGLGEPLSESSEQSVPIDDTAGGWLLVMPIQLSGEHIGTLLALRRSQSFHAEERAALERVASLFALQASSERHWQQRIQLAKVHERERLADDLHDDVVQLLYGIQLNLDLAVETTEEAGTHDRLLRSRELAASADKILRQMIADRSDPVAPELRWGIGEIVERMRREHGLEVVDSFAGDPRNMTDGISQLMLRIVRECLTNVAKHAKSKKARLHVEVSADEVELVISDDGAGIGRRRGVEGYGLASMRRSVARHGGQLTVASTSRGTTVTATMALR